MERLTVDKPVSEMTMVELAHNSCFVKGRQAFYRDFDREINARQFARELANMFGYELPEDDEEFDYEIMDDLPITENVSKRELIALFYRNLWAQADLYQYLKSYEETGITPEQIREIDKLYAEKCRELAEERKKHEWIPCSKRLPENISHVIVQVKEIKKPTVGWYGNMVGWRLTERDFADLKDFTVIAWKPFPESYDPERSNT